MQKVYQQNADFLIGLLPVILSGFVLQRGGVAMLPVNLVVGKMYGGTQDHYLQLPIITLSKSRQKLIGVVKLPPAAKMRL